jgi:glycosyltransferase involved in cell wall biosynthesis
MTIHVWVPDYLASTGGIQVLSRFFVRALRECFPEARIVVVGKNDTSIPDLHAAGIDAFYAVGWWSRPLRTVAFAARLWRLASIDRPDLIITTHANFSPVARWLKKMRGIPFSAVGNGIDVWNIPSEQIRMALRSADQLLAISRFTRERMAAAIDLPLERMELFPCTFDSEEFKPAPKPHFLLKRYGLDPEQPVVLTVARLASAERYKGYDQALHALATVRSALPNVRYILGGTGPDRPRVVELIEKLDLHDNVILAGHIPQHELCAHYNLCDVFTMPSKGEGFGIVFLEALACGKPVIAGNKDGSVDALLNGKLGVLVDPDKPEAIAQALVQVLSKTYPLPILREPLELRRRAVDAYGYERFVTRVRETVGPLLNGATGPK